MADPSEKLSMFLEVTGSQDITAATHFLEAASWDLSDAIAMATSDEPPRQPRRAALSPSRNAPSSVINVKNEDDDESNKRNAEQSVVSMDTNDFSSSNTNSAAKTVDRIYPSLFIKDEDYEFHDAVAVDDAVYADDVSSNRSSRGRINSANSNRFSALSKDASSFPRKKIANRSRVKTEDGAVEEAKIDKTTANGSIADQLDTSSSSSIVFLTSSAKRNNKDLLAESGDVKVLPAASLKNDFSLSSSSSKAAGEAASFKSSANSSSSSSRSKKQQQQQEQVDVIVTDGDDDDDDRGRNVNKHASKINMRSSPLAGFDAPAPAEVVIADDDDDEPEEDADTVDDGDDDDDDDDDGEIISINDDDLLLRAPSPKTASRSSASPKHGDGSSGKASKQPFIPALMPAEAPAIELFRQRFSETYGDKADALFFIGSLPEAVVEAFDSRSLDSRRMVAVYLHHVESVAVNVFVNSILLDDAVLNLIAENFVLWPWDCSTFESRLRFKAILNHIAPDATDVTDYPADSYPYMFILDKHKNQVQALYVVNGHHAKSEVVQRLMGCLQIHSDFLHQEEKEDLERLKRMQEREEQNLAFEESLAADRAKEEAKRVEAQKLVEIEKQRVSELQAKELERKKLEEELAPEPPATAAGGGNGGAGDSVVVIRMRIPDGENLVRRFYHKQPLSDLVKYAHAKGYPSSEYVLRTQYPSRDLGTLDAAKSLKELGMGRTENVFVEQR